MHLNGEIVKMSFEEKNFYGNGQMDRRFMILKKRTPGVGLQIFFLFYTIHGHFPIYKAGGKNAKTKNF